MRDAVKEKRENMKTNFSRISSNLQSKFGNGNGNGAMTSSTSMFLGGNQNPSGGEVRGYYEQVRPLRHLFKRKRVDNICFPEIPFFGKIGCAMKR
jgi:hypothetical protein